MSNHCSDGLSHYEVLSPEVCFSTGQGIHPPEYGHCWGLYLAKNKRNARLQAVRDDAFWEWVKDMRADGKPPFAGLEVSLFRCEHGDCYECPSSEGCLECRYGCTITEMMQSLKAIEAACTE